MRRLIGSDGHPPRSSTPQTLGPRFGSGLDVPPIRSDLCRADRDTTYGDAGRRRAFEARARSPQRLSSQLVRHRGDAGHDAFLVAFGTRSAYAEHADRLVAHRFEIVRIRIVRLYKHATSYCSIDYV